MRIQIASKMYNNACCNLQISRYVLCLGKLFAKPHWWLGLFLDFFPLLASFLVLHLFLNRVIHTMRATNSLRCSNTHSVVTILLSVFLVLGYPGIFTSGVRQLSIMTAAQVPDEVVIMQRAFHVLASHNATQGDKRVVSYRCRECLTQFLVDRCVVKVFLRLCSNVAFIRA